jgi:hypothetical protein
MRPPSVVLPTVAPEGDAAPTGAGPAALPGVDPAALAQYRGRLAELRAERADAVARADLAARRAAEAEIEWLEHELRGAFGVGGVGPGEFAQKARKAVYNRIRAAIAAIAQAHPELGLRLRHSIRTGVVCAYQPESPEECSSAMRRVASRRLRSVRRPVQRSLPDRPSGPLRRSYGPDHDGRSARVGSSARIRPGR